jgi:hypothetical protein
MGILTIYLHFLHYFNIGIYSKFIFTSYLLPIILYKSIRFTNSYALHYRSYCMGKLAGLFSIGFLRNPLIISNVANVLYLPGYERRNSQQSCTIPSVGSMILPSSQCWQHSYRKMISRMFPHYNPRKRVF